MAPEYDRVYIPPKYVERYESFVAAIPGAKSTERRGTLEDFLQPSGNKLSLEEVAKSTKVLVSQIPDQVTLKPFALWENMLMRKQHKDIENYLQLWEDFMLSIPIYSRHIITRSINTLTRYLAESESQPTFASARALDWNKPPKIYQLGSKGKAFLTHVLSK